MNIIANIGKVKDLIIENNN